MAASLISSAASLPCTSRSELCKSSLFGTETTRFFSLPSSSRRVHVSRRFNPPSVYNSFNHIPKQFRQENLKEGLMKNYENIPDSFYGLSSSQMNMFTTEDSPVRRKSRKVTEESISASSSYRNYGGMCNISNMASTNSSIMFRGGGGISRRPRSAPPDLPSLLLDSRIVFLGMPIFPAVTELIVAQLMYLDFEDTTKPIYMYINSPGMQDENGEVIGPDTDAYAIADSMNLCKSKIYTINVSMAYGQAAMLLALGEKGYRAVQPTSSTKLSLPETIDVSGDAKDMWLQGRELQSYADCYVDLLSEGIGKPKEEIYKDIEFDRYFSAEAAVAYGIADKILTTSDKAFEERNYDALTSEARVARKDKAKTAPKAGTGIGFQA